MGKLVKEELLSNVQQKAISALLCDYIEQLQTFDEIKTSPYVQ